MTKIAGYADRVSAAPGETISFMVSSEAPSYKCDIVRIICGDENPNGPGVKEQVVRTPANGTYKGRRQVCYDGSFLEVPAHRAIQGLKSFTFQAFIWPTTPDRGTQALIANWRDRDKAGAALIITKQNGSLALCLGDGKGKIEVIATNRPLIPHEWYFVAASYDAKSKQVVLVQQPLKEYPKVAHGGIARKKSTLRAPGKHDAPLTMGAYFRRVDKGRTVCNGFYNGRIDSPRIANRALSLAEMELAKTSPGAEALGDAIVGAWDFSQGITTTQAVDTSPNGLDGKLVNLPTRAVTGWNWDASEMNWRNAPEQYGAIHFHEDDLYDAGWEVDFSLTVPKRLKSGVYAARLRGGGSEEYVPFAVRAPRGAPTAKICFLLPTASYMAYANTNMATDIGAAQLLAGRLAVLNEKNLQRNAHREYGTSLYDSHIDGSGICYSSRLRPILNFRPKALEWIGGTESTLWQFNADTHLTDWLEARGFDYDVVTDEDLHYEGLSAIQDYRVVLSGSHPEYHSKAMWDAMDAYQKRGGRLMYMGANGWYWRIAFHTEVPGCIEVRRAEDGIRTWIARPGEYYHSFTGEYGGLWRRNGRPPQLITGAGFTAQGFDISSYYVRPAGQLQKRGRLDIQGDRKGREDWRFRTDRGRRCGSRARPRGPAPRHAAQCLCAGEFGGPHRSLSGGVRRAGREPAQCRRHPGSAGPRRHRVLRDGERRSGVLHQLHRLVREPRAQQLQKQRLPHDGKRPAPLRRPETLLSRELRHEQADRSDHRRRHRNR